MSTMSMYIKFDKIKDRHDNCNNKMMNEVAWIVSRKLVPKRGGRWPARLEEGSTAEKCQVPLDIDKPKWKRKEVGGEAKERGQVLREKNNNNNSSKKCMWRKRNKRRGKEGRRAGAAANEEDAFRKGLGRVCGEPVARR